LEDAKEFVHVLHVKTYAVVFNIIDALLVFAIAANFHGCLGLVL